MSKVLIAGGGAAGMFAAITAAKNGHEVHVYEKNEKLGKKLFITGKGRCNLTNACDLDELMQSIRRNPKFLYSAFYGYNNYDIMGFFGEAGLDLKVERGNRVFPESDHSSDVIRVLRDEMQKQGVKVHLNTEIRDVVCDGERFRKIVLKSKEEVKGDALIITTGGLSYPVTGSDGDGYKFARKMGHEVTELTPALVPFEVKEAFAKQLQGLSLRNVRATLYQGRKELYSEMGEMMFTHFGVTGPLILSASCEVPDYSGELKLKVDLKPALSPEQLDNRLLREFENNKNKQFKNAVTGLFPSKLIPVMIEQSRISPERKINSIQKEERLYFVEKIKGLEMTVTGCRDFKEAIITRGGISIKEVNPKTMESKKKKGIYFAGEILDVDAVTGGFNLQIAWSTGYAAGNAIE